MLNKMISIINDNNLNESIPNKIIFRKEIKSIKEKKETFKVFILKVLDFL